MYRYVELYLTQIENINIRDIETKRMSIERTYRNMIESIEVDEDSSLEELTEIRVLRVASALVFAQNAKKAGQNVVSVSQQGKTKLNTIKKDSSVEQRLEVLSDSMSLMFDALIENRKQIGNLVGVALTSAVVSERSAKQLIKLLNKRR